MRNEMHDDAAEKFGGFIYGREPLVLPPVGDGAMADSVSSHTHADELNELLRLIDQPLSEGSDLTQADPEERYWFRWLTGHQVSFVLWQLTAELLTGLKRGDVEPHEAAADIASYIDGYAAMLLYTGSCPRDIYTAVIRPSMRRQHPAFSGLWAPDYLPVRGVMRGREGVLGGADFGVVKEAAERLQRVHDAIADKLVEGPSLLSESVIRPPAHDHSSYLYDAYFLTIRQPVSRAAIVSQLLRRLAAVARDLRAVPVSDDQCVDAPNGLFGAMVPQSIEGTLVQIASRACRDEALRRPAPQPSGRVAL